jgi:hypothetical protein
MRLHLSAPFRFSVTIATAALLPACQTAYPDSTPADFQISLDRGACFGTCPVYSLTVSGNGSVSYTGLSFVTVEGDQEASLSPDVVAQLFQAVVSADFFGLDDRYEVLATDLPSITTTVTMDGQTKTIYHYGLGCGTDLDLAPPGLCEIEALLESIPASEGWVSID